MDTIKTSRHISEIEHENELNMKKAPEPEPSPDPDCIPVRDPSCYQENTLLIVLTVLQLLPIVFPVVYQRELFHIFIILSAVVMYYDAKNIRAGNNFEKETLLGNIVTWRPISWGLMTFLGGAIIMAIYLFHRKEIYNANNWNEKNNGHDPGRYQKTDVMVS